MRQPIVSPRGPPRKPSWALPAPHPLDRSPRHPCHFISRYIHRQRTRHHHKTLIRLTLPAPPAERSAGACVSACPRTSQPECSFRGLSSRRPLPAANAPDPSWKTAPDGASGSPIWPTYTHISTPLTGPLCWHVSMAASPLTGFLAPIVPSVWKLYDGTSPYLSPPTWNSPISPGQSHIPNEPA